MQKKFIVKQAEYVTPSLEVLTFCTDDVIVCSQVGGDWSSDWNVFD